MTTPIRPEASLEGVLAQQANDAIAQGADPKATTARLDHMLQYLRSNPEIARHGGDALGAGADHHAVAGRIWELAQAAPSGAGREFGGPDDTTDFSGREQTAGFVEKMADAAPFVTKASAASYALGDAAYAAAHGSPFLATLKRAYNKNYEARQNALRKYSEDPSSHSTLATVTGVALPALATLGTSLAAGGGAALAEAAPSLGARVLKGAGTGALWGAAQGASNAHGTLDDYERQVLTGGAAGAATGGVLAPVAGALVGKIARPVGRGVSRVADYLSERQPAGRAKDLTQAIARATGAGGRASERLGTAVAADRAAGFTPPVPVSGLPAVALDEAGPAVVGVAEGIAQRPGVGRSILHEALGQRAEQVRPMLSEAFDKGTGTTAQQGEALLNKLADEHARLDRAVAAAKQLRAEDKASAAVPAARPNVLASWRQEIGGSLSNGIQALKQAVAEKNATAAELYGQARAATAGQALETPTLNAVRKTPIGKLAEAWARAQKANRMSKLPVTDVPDEAAIRTLVEQGVPPARAAQFGGTVRKELPDPETVHFMKQFLAKAARLGVHDGQGGKLATQAQSALNVWGQVRSELPEVWRQADEATASKFRVVDAVNMGRDLMRTQLNPSGSKALHTSLDAIEQRFAAMSPEEQQAARVGMQSAITDYLRSASRSPSALAMQLREPTSALARKVTLAMGDPEAAARLADRITRPQTLVHTVTPPSGLPSEAVRATERGLDLLKHGVSAPGNAPERSLAVLERDVAGLPPSEQAAFRAAGAQAVRGAAAEAPRGAPTRAYGGTGSPERARQVAQAFPNAQAANDFQRFVQASERVLAQRDQILRGSQTAFRGASHAADEGDLGPGVLRSLLHGNAGTALSQLTSNVSRSAAKRATAQEDELIARWLTSPDARVLPDAVRMALLRKSAPAGLRQLMAHAFGSAAGKAATQ